jgi:hypothetical protein
MKKLSVLLFFICCAFNSFSQSFGNEWIDYSGNKKYYSFKVYKDGIHRISYNTLVNAGINVASIDPNSFQVYGREQELYIHVEGSGDNVFDPADYIEFYGEKNDGRLDTLLYKNAMDQSLGISAESQMPDLYYSLYNDTTHYYLTWNTSVSNKRMVELTDTSFSSFNPVNWIWYTSFVKLADLYVQGPLTAGASSSHFNLSEGWYSGYLNSLDPWGYYHDTYLNTSNSYNGPGAPDAELTTAAAGTSNAWTFTGSGNHHFRVQYGPATVTVFDTIFTGYQLIKKKLTIPNAILPVGSLLIRYMGINDQGAQSDYFAVASNSIRYPHSMNLGGANTFKMEVPFNISESKSRLSLTNYFL